MIGPISLKSVRLWLARIAGSNEQIHTILNGVLKTHTVNTVTVSVSGTPSVNATIVGAPTVVPVVTYYADYNSNWPSYLNRVR